MSQKKTSAHVVKLIPGLNQGQSLNYRTHEFETASSLFCGIFNLFERTYQFDGTQKAVFQFGFLAKNNIRCQQLD